MRQTTRRAPTRLDHAGSEGAGSGSAGFDDQAVPGTARVQPVVRAEIDATSVVGVDLCDVDVEGPSLVRVRGQPVAHAIGEEVRTLERRSEVERVWHGEDQ